ncbi:phytanoyl-CoA dioxygenase family protein [Geminicoccaceae bacterium 1502E]|nr:phytanoyl-CoA dioxygenase family protein [Geminicoccaceae bacterium 1502E]
MSAAFPPLEIAGRKVPPSMLGELVAADPEGDLAAQLDQHGYLLLRSALEAGEVAAARAEVLARLAEVGEIAAPVADAIASGTSRRSELYPDLGAFWRSVSEGPALRRVSHGPLLAGLMERLWGGPVAALDFLWLRAMARGKASPLHVDHPYMNRGTDRLATAWIPLGEVGLEEGPLFMLEGSHRLAELRTRFAGLDIDRQPGAKGHVEEHPIDFARAHGCRFLTTRFLPGDCMVFSMFTAHAAFDNGSAGGRVRLSCDCRWQPAGEPMDERFAGPDPRAHGGKGYGCLMAARPLGETLALR